MEANYKRDLNHNYLILKCDDQTKAEGYEIKMLTENKIDGFLAVNIRYVDGNMNLYYEISSKQSMKRVFENREIGYNLLREFLFHFQHILVIAEEFLVDTKHLIIQPEFLYMNIESNEIALVFHPDYEQDVKEAFQNMAEYFLNKIDHQDNKAVILAYQLYKNTRNNNFTIKEMLTFLQEETTTIPFSPNGITKQKEINPKINPKMNQIKNSETITGIETITGEDSRTRTEKKIEGGLESGIKDLWENEFAYFAESADSLQDNKLPFVSEKQKQPAGHNENNPNDGYINDRRECKTEAVFFKIEVFLIIILLAIVAARVTNLIKMSYQEFILGCGIIFMSLTIIAVKIYLNRKRIVIRENDHHYEDVMKESIETEFKEKKKERSNSMEELSDTEEIQIIDFLSEPVALQQKEEVYGNTILLGSTHNIEQKRLIGKVHGKEMECYLEHFPFTVGKLGSHVDLELKDSSISRMHARFIEKEGNLYLEDLNSTNGSFKNGVPLEANETVRVESGDKICFAKICFTYH